MRSALPGGGRVPAATPAAPALRLAAAGAGARALVAPALPGRAAATPPAPPLAAAAAAHRRAGGWATQPRRALHVVVEYNNVDKALRKLKRKMIEEGITKQLKERQHFQKPAELRVRRRGVQP